MLHNGLLVVLYKKNELTNIQAKHDSFIINTLAVEK